MEIKPAPYGTTVVGRIQQWMDSPDEILGVSCTVCVPENRLFGENSITESWIYCSRGLRNAAGVAVHLSNIIQVSRASKVVWRAYLDQKHPDAGECPSDWAFPPKDDEYVIKLADSMQKMERGGISIESSWDAFVKSALEGRKIVVDVSELRPSHSENGRGLTASGPKSFVLIYEQIAKYLETGRVTDLGAIYSALNQTLRRGGLYKNGAVTLHIDYNHQGALEFIRSERKELPFARICLNIDEGFTSTKEDGSYAYDIDEFLKKVVSGDVFLQKIKYCPISQERLFGNVCLEIFLNNHGTCLLAHENLGKLKIEEIADGIENGVEWLTEVHPITGVEKMGYYLPPSQDRQIGYGVVGLASCLAANEITYAEFNDALEYSLRIRGYEIFEPKYRVISNKKALELTEALYEGFQRGAAIGKAKNFHRVFTVAPTASCSYRSKDLLGYSCTPEIAAPIATSIERVSDAHDTVEYDYNPDCETADKVGWEEHWRLNCLWQTLMNSTGVAHSISTNWWVDQTVMDRSLIERFLKSPLWSLYYALPTAQNQDKSEVIGAVKKDYCSACAQ